MHFTNDHCLLIAGLCIQQVSFFPYLALLIKHNSTSLSQTLQNTSWRIFSSEQNSCSTYLLSGKKKIKYLKLLSIFLVTRKKRSIIFFGFSYTDILGILVQSTFSVVVVVNRGMPFFACFFVNVWSKKFRVLSGPYFDSALASLESFAVLILSKAE